MAKRDITPPPQPPAQDWSEFMSTKEIAALFDVPQQTVVNLFKGKMTNRKIHRGALWSLIQLGLSVVDTGEAKAPGKRRIGPHVEQRTRIFERDGDNCRYCGKRTTQITRRIDHILPWSLGGRNYDVNLAACCHACNAKKGVMTVYQAKMTLLPSPNGSKRLNAIQQSLAWGLEKYQHYKDWTIPTSD